MTTEKPLTAAQFSYLALLMAEAREVPNTELKARYGISITGQDSAALVDRKLATAKTLPRNALSHELTDEGWAEAKKAMAADYVKAQGAGPASAALHAVLAAVHRFMERSDQSAAEVFAASKLPPLPPATSRAVRAVRAESTSAPKTGKVDVPARIRNAYKKLKIQQNRDWISLVDLRRTVNGVSHEHLDAALLEMVAKKKIRLIPEENRKSVTEAVQSAAIFVSGEEKHLIGIGVA